jgi:hypothetical protein
MDTCSACEEPLDDLRLADPATGEGYHAACAANRLPQDALVALVAAAARVLAPTVLLWAG